MSVFFQTFAQVLPDQRGGFYTRFGVYEYIAEETPIDSVVPDADSFTLQRYFKTKEQAKKFGNYLCTRYSAYSCLPPPTANNLKLDLLLEIV